MARLIPFVLLFAAAGTVQAQDEQFKKAGVCSRCHVISVVEWGISRHAAASTGCVACHGASEGHVIDERNNVKPERIPRGAASASLCKSCHVAGCPKSKRTDQCTDCHHFHALLDPSKPAAAKDDRTDRIAAAWKDADRRVAEGERLAGLQQWAKARDEFLAALASRPSDARVRDRLAYCERRVNPVLQGFEAQDKELDKASGLPRRVRVAGLAIEMVLVPAGESDIGDPRFHDSTPVHTVGVEPFYLGKYEVTQSEWTTVMGTPATDAVGARKSAANISWDDAVQFVRRLNSRVPGEGFRLPTEAEWEHAARKTINLTDMRGGLWEWCSTLFRPYPYSANDGRESASAKGLRVLRGGGYLDTEDLLDPAFRHSERPSRRLPVNGLRLARSVPRIAAVGGN